MHVTKEDVAKAHDKVVSKEENVNQTPRKNGISPAEVPNGETPAPPVVVDTARLKRLGENGINIVNTLLPMEQFFAMDKIARISF